MNQKGVTLIELLIVIVVMGITSSFSVPAVGKIFDNTEKDAVLNSAYTIENAARLYCVQPSKAGCEIDGVLSETELGDYVFGLDPTYTYSATKTSSNSWAVVYAKEGEFSYPFDTNGAEIEDGIPSASSRDHVNVYDGTVVDTGPVIPEGEPYVILNGPSTVYVEVRTTYDDPGAVAYNSDGISLGSASNWDGDYYGTLGTFARTYQTWSSLDDKFTLPGVRTVIVQDTIPPVIYLQGQVSMTVSAGTNWVNYGPTHVLDNSNENLSWTEEEDTLVYPLAAGVYTMTYTATDSSGNTTVVTQTITAE